MAPRRTPEEEKPTRPADPGAAPKGLEVVPISPPPAAQRRQREARFVEEGGKRDRYSLPQSLESTSPVGYRTRVSLDRDEAEQAMQLLSLARPTRFTPGAQVREGELFEASSLGILVSRQSTNYRGQRQVTFGPEDSARVAHLLRSLDEREADVLDNAAYTHVVLSMPYRTPFTALLTLVGHPPVLSLGTVPWRLWQKKTRYVDDIPTIGYLQHLHIGILADAIERAEVIASEGRRRAQVLMAPFCGRGREKNRPILRAIEELCGISPTERAAGWRVALVAQVGEVPEPEQITLPQGLWRKLGANLLALRSERIQPGVNAEEKAPEPFQQRQDMDVPDALTVQAGRAAYNAFAHWTGLSREEAKDLLLAERVDVLTPGGKERLRAIRQEQNAITDKLIERMPSWADLPTGKLFSRNAERGRKAFGLAGQRIYIVGVSKREMLARGLDWLFAVRASGAACARGALYAELMGVTELPPDCDLLAGICLMAGPVNQNDIGKQFYGFPDLLASSFPERDPTSLLVWTLKAKTVADPIGNEEQLLNARRKGALVDLRPGPHEVVRVKTAKGLEPMRKRAGRVNAERAFHDVGNFVVDPEGRGIPGNRGEPWPQAWADAVVWSGGRGGEG
ncbi:MAG: hypothetical protein H6747_15600 [Deltaproteobacteria bacterium]|nr:hypothetical protein [Deltaproteobacteria bacterium]